MANFMYTPWNIGTEVIDLITPAHFSRLPNGTRLTSISGKRVTKGVDRIDDETHGGMLAYGLPGRSQTDLKTYRGPYRTR